MYSHINVQGRTSEKTFLYIYFRYFSCLSIADITRKSLKHKQKDHGIGEDRF